MKLNVSDRPTVEPGDELLIRDDFGESYRATVTKELDADRVRVRLPPTNGPHPKGSTSRVYRKEELEGAYVRADLLINPERPPKQRVH